MRPKNAHDVNLKANSCALMKHGTSFYTFYVKANLAVSLWLPHLHFVFFPKFAVAIMLSALNIRKVQFFIGDVDGLALQAFPHLLRE